MRRLASRRNERTSPGRLVRSTGKFSSTRGILLPWFAPTSPFSVVSPPVVARSQTVPQRVGNLTGGDRGNGDRRPLFPLLPPVKGRRCSQAFLPTTRTTNESGSMAGRCLPLAL